MFNIQLLNNHGTRLVILGLTLGAIMISFSGVWVKVSHVAPTTSTFFLGFENYRLGNSFRIPFRFNSASTARACFCLGCSVFSETDQPLKLDRCLCGAFSHLFRNSAAVAPKTM